MSCRGHHPLEVQRNDTVSLLRKVSISILNVMIVLLAIWVTPSEAAPLPPAVTLAFLQLFKLVGLIVDTAVAVFVLRNYRLRMIRVAAAFLVTAILFTALFFPLILPAFDGDVLAGGMFMMLLQTAALFAFVNLDWFRNDTECDAPLIRTLFLAAFCGSAAMVCFSICVMAPLQLWLLRLLIRP